MALAVVAITACGGDSTGPWGGQPAAGRWDAIHWIGRQLPYHSTVDGVTTVIDSVWIIVATDGTVHFTEARHKTPGDPSTYEMDGVFKRIDGNPPSLVLQLTDPYSGPRPDAAVTLSDGGTRMTVESQGHDDDVYVLRQ